MGLGNLLKLNSRMKIGVRVLGGFSLVLALLVMMSAMGYFGLTSVRTSFASYEAFSEHATQALEIDRNFIELLRNVVAYSNNADEETLVRIHKLQQSVADEVKALGSRLVLPDDKEMMARIGGLVDQVVKNQNLAIEQEAKRDKLN